jgi:hypothetical protein
MILYIYSFRVGFILSVITNMFQDICNCGTDSHFTSRKTKKSHNKITVTKIDLSLKEHCNPQQMFSWQGFLAFPTLLSLQQPDERASMNKPIHKCCHHKLMRSNRNHLGWSLHQFIIAKLPQFWQPNTYLSTASLCPNWPLVCPPDL